MNLLTGATGSGLGAAIGVKVRFTLVSAGESLAPVIDLAGADTCFCTGFGAAGLGPVILALTGTALDAGSGFGLRFVLALGAGFGV